MAREDAPPQEAVRRRGVSGVAVLLIALIMLGAGVGIGYYAFRTPAGPEPPKEYLIVGTNVPFPPFEDFNTTSGDFEGFDIDIAKLIATELNRTLIVRQFSSFTTLLATVGNGGVDMAVSAITMSGASGTTRNQTMDFSDPYYNANQGVLVQDTSTLSCANNECRAQDLQGLTVGVQQGTTSQSWIDANGHPSTTVVVFQTVDAEIAALQSGNLDAVIIDYDPAVSLASPGSGLRVEGAIITNELYGIAVPDGDPDGIVPAINSVLARIRADGTYDQHIQKWFA